MRGTALIGVVWLAVLASPARAATVDVTVANNAFTPAQLTITQGDVVTWTFAGPDTNHSTTTEPSAEPSSWDSDPRTDSPNHQAGDKFSRDFTYVGEFDYFCKVHGPAMSGRIVVQPRAPGAPPPVDVEAPRMGPLLIAARQRRVTFDLNEAAAVEARIRRRGYRALLTLDGRVGTNTLRLPRLEPGRYSLIVRATDPAGNESVAERVKFRAPKRRR